MSSKQWLEDNKERVREYKRKYYENNKQEQIRKLREKEHEMFEWVEQLKSNLKCERCNENHPATLDFHHVNPEEKDIEISQAVKAGWNKDRILEEVSKCMVLCSNCHRKLHYEERRG